MSDSDKTRGLYDKFRVTRVDGSSEAGNKHSGCDYFVLDLTHDKHALPALAAYSVSCADEYPQLSADLKAKCGHELGAWEVANIERDARIAELEAICQSVPEGCTPADAQVLREANHALAAEVERLKLPPDETLSEHPGCAFCMEAGTPVRPGQVCPECGDRLPTKREYELAKVSAELERVRREWVPLYSGGKGNP